MARASQKESVARFESILFREAKEPDLQGPNALPDTLRDLNLDRVFESITSAWKEFQLTPFFHAPLHSVDAIAFRQEVMRDLEDELAMQAVKAFSDRMRMMAAHRETSVRSYYEHERNRSFLSAVERYCEAVTSLSADLTRLPLRSTGMRSLRDYLSEYRSSAGFEELCERCVRLVSDLAAVKYVLLIDGDEVTVREYAGETEYTMVVETIFEKFRRGSSKDYLVRFPEGSGINHIQAQVLDGVARLYPETFAALAAFHAHHPEFPDSRITRFYREVQFYVAYLSYIGAFRRAGLSFCYPILSRMNKEVSSRDAFDIALAEKLLVEGRPIVCNDFHLRGAERLIVVSGPNQGGKTTLARMFGQLHFLANLGCPIPGTEGQVHLFDRIFTHFEREEDIRTLRGKLQDDLVRIRNILDVATPQSIVIMNEIFSSTTLKDAIDLSKKVISKLLALDLVGVWVTFLTELSSMSEKTVSMVSTIDPTDPAIRTYKVVRREADGVAYALAIARKYRLTYEAVKERIKR